MDLKDEFINSINEEMNSQDTLDETLSLVEDFYVPEEIYSGVYLEEMIDTVFPQDESIQKRLMQLHANI